MPSGDGGWGEKRPAAPEQVTRQFARLARREDLPPVRLHDLRHVAATLALAAGADPKVIQAILGHAGILLTADIHTRQPINSAYRRPPSIVRGYANFSPGRPS
jgi:integrase